MRLSGIRSRMLVAALAPVTLVVISLATLFSTSRMSDLDESHKLRAQSMVRQLALASEYGLFSGNTPALQVVANGMQSETDISGVAIFNAEGQLLAKAGTIHFKEMQDAVVEGRPTPGHERGVELLVEAVVSSSTKLDDLFSPPTSSQPSSNLLGFAVLEVSRERVNARGHEILMIALSVGGVGLLLGGLFALYLGEGVMRPVLRVSRRIERIGSGDLSPDLNLLEADPLYGLQVRLNEMARRLAGGREELEERVEAATRELRKKKDEAETATQAKSRFLAAASHDLRQPLHAMGMFVARLRQLPLDDTTKRLVSNLDTSVLSLQDLLDGLLDISRLDAGVVQVRKTAVRLDALFLSLQRSLAPLAERKGLRLRVRPCDQWALTDAVLLQSILMNLANNALNYTDSGTVLICCRIVSGGTQLRIDVADSGIGVSPEHQSQIFREFFQVGNPGRDRKQGLGLGLNIVERTAKLLNHPVTLRSNLGCGTRFSIFLPRTKAPELPRLEGGGLDLEDSDGLQGLRVLVVDDNDIALQAIGELLVSWGCAVYSVSTVEQVDSILMDEPHIDLVLSDYRLGGSGNGFDVIAAVRKQLGRNVEACLMSGDTDAGLLQAAQDAELVLLHKPVRAAKLKSLLRRLTAKKRSA